ncbi:general substrate transporter [Xylariaceae sp. FL1651]|nr:general substrate transporter [Xylariaceae sp. FL1651]
MSVNTPFGLQGSALSRLQLALIVCPAFVLFGYNQAGLGGLLTEENWVKTFPGIDTVSSTGAEKSQKSTIQGVVVAVFVLGALVGALSCSWSGDRFGRRHVIFVGALCTLIGIVLEASAFSLSQFIVGRVVLGLGVGQLSSIVPVWQSETSGAKNRGQHVVLDGLFICLGYVLESFIDLGFFEYHHGPVTWRPPIAISTVFSLVLIGSVYSFPESPRWLLMKNKGEQARANLAVLRGLSEDSPEVGLEIMGIEHSLETTRMTAAKLSDLIKMGEDKLAYRFGLCILLQFYQQLSGSNLISVYATILFQQNLGLSSEISRVLSAGALLWKFLSSFLAFICIDRFGRRAVFIVSGFGMSACMVALAIATSFNKNNTSAQIAAGVFIYLFNTFVPIGFLGANFLYCTEIAPLRLRMAMSSISTANHWLWNFVVAMVTPVAINTIGWRYYIVFAAVGAVIPISVWTLFPETMGRSLEEIDLIFRQSPSVWKTVRFAKTHPIGLLHEYNEKPRDSIDPELEHKY